MTLRSELDPAMQEHFDKYDVLAHRLGVASLKSIQPFTRAEVQKALETDLHMDSLPLKQWDACDHLVRYWAHAAGIKSWSLGNTVCVLKHVARHYYA